MRRARRAALVCLVVLLALAGCTQAESGANGSAGGHWSRSDPVGDVVQRDLNGPDPDRPTRADRVDLTEARASFTRKALTMRVGFHRLVHAGSHEMEVDIATSPTKSNYSFQVFDRFGAVRRSGTSSPPGLTTVSPTHDDVDEVDCPGYRFGVDYRARTATALVPTRCLGAGVRWVRLRVTMAWETARAAAADSWTGPKWTDIDTVPRSPRIHIRG